MDKKSDKDDQNDKDVDATDIQNFDEKMNAPSLSQGDVSIDSVLKQQAKPVVDEAIKLQRKKYIKYGSIGGALLIVLLMIFSCEGSKGPMEYGVCSTYLEMNTPYPHTLQYTGVEGSRTSIRIYYTSIDPFGQYKLEMIECKFNPGKWEVTEILKNRRPVDPAEVKKFNRILPALVTSELYLELPPNWKNPSVR